MSRIGKTFSNGVNKGNRKKGRVSPMKGMFSEKHPRSVKVLQFDLDDNFIKEWSCLMDIKRELNYHIGNISSCLKGKLKSYKKYKWKYKY